MSRKRSTSARSSKVTSRPRERFRGDHARRILLAGAPKTRDRMEDVRRGNFLEGRRLKPRPGEDQHRPGLPECRSAVDHPGPGRAIADAQAEPAAQAARRFLIDPPKPGEACDEQSA